MQERRFGPPEGHRTVTHAAITRFGELTGDYAAMHFDRDQARANGMEETIAHGLLSGAWALGALARFAPERLGLGDPRAFPSEFSVGFRRMTAVGDLFSVRWRTGDGDADADDGSRRTDFEVVNQRD